MKLPQISVKFLKSTYSALLTNNQHWVGKIILQTMFAAFCSCAATARGEFAECLKMQRYKQRSWFFLILGEKLDSDDHDHTNLFQPCDIIIAFMRAPLTQYHHVPTIAVQY